VVILVRMLKFTLEDFRKDSSGGERYSIYNPLITPKYSFQFVHLFPLFSVNGIRYNNPAQFGEGGEIE